MCKSRVEFKGKTYDSLRDCWNDVGKVPYGTTRTRLHRTDNLAYALGHGPSPNTHLYNSKPVILPNGLTYNSIKEMCEHLNLNKNTIYNYMR